MHLLIGGAWQGKTEYAKRRFALTDADFYTCEGTEIPRDARAICHLERFSRACVAAGRDPIAVWQALDPAAEVVICDEIFSGIVPLDAQDRLWREQTGRLLAALAQTAERVTRVFCGLPLELKP